MPSKETIGLYSVCPGGTGALRYWSVDTQKKKHKTNVWNYHTVPTQQQHKFGKKQQKTFWRYFFFCVVMVNNLHHQLQLPLKTVANLLWNHHFPPIHNCPDQCFNSQHKVSKSRWWCYFFCSSNGTERAFCWGKKLKLVLANSSLWCWPTKFNDAWTNTKQALCKVHGTEHIWWEASKGYHR